MRYLTNVGEILGQLVQTIEKAVPAGKISVSYQRMRRFLVC
nr:hypothetical protein [uncultured Blautia sp.]